MDNMSDKEKDELLNSILDEADSSKAEQDADASPDNGEAENAPEVSQTEESSSDESAADTEDTPPVQTEENS